jgi:hypothetical protein
MNDNVNDNCQLLHGLCENFLYGCCNFSISVYVKEIENSPAQGNKTIGLKSSIVFNPQKTNHYETDNNDCSRRTDVY